MEYEIDLKPIKFEEEKVMDIKEEIEELRDKIRELEAKIKNERNWKPKYDEYYWIVDLDTMTIDSLIWDNDEYDKVRYAHRVVFETENEAREYLKYLEKKEEYMNTFTEEEWENPKIEKWYYGYDYEDEAICCDFRCVYKNNVSYFKTKEETKDFVQKYEWQIKHELGVD